MILNLDPVRALERCVNHSDPAVCAVCPYASSDAGHPCVLRLAADLDPVLSSLCSKKAERFLSIIYSCLSCDSCSSDCPYHLFFKDDHHGEFLRCVYNYLKRKGYIFAMMFQENNRLPDRLGKEYAE